MKRVLLLVLLITGCVQLPPTGEDIQAKKFEVVADKAVIYVIRPQVDSQEPGSLIVDTGHQVSTLPGTYHRLEVAPGVRLFEGMSPPSVRLVLNTEAGKIYFLRFYVRGTARSGATDARLHPVSAEEGRSLVAQGQLYP